MSLTKVTDKEVLSRFTRGNVIRNDEEARILMRYASWFCLGLFDSKTKEARACMTDYGRYHFKEIFG